MDKRGIGVFDSGLGGLTVVKQLRACMPTEDIVYLGDTGRVPYGNRTPETIRTYAKQDAAFLLTHDVKAIIVACGTASSVLSGDDLKAFGVPAITVIGPASRAAVLQTKNRKVGVIGTAATVASGAYQKAIESMDAEVNVFQQACPLFVPLVENGYLSADDVVVQRVVADYLTGLKNEGVDTLILGCTHYPLLFEAIARFMGPGVTLVDAGKVTAEFAKEVFTGLELSTAPNRHGNVHYYVSDGVELFSAVASIFLEERIQGFVRPAKIVE